MSGSDPVATHVSIDKGSGHNLLTKEEFFSIAIDERLLLILDKKVRFLSETGNEIPLRKAVEGASEVEKIRTLFSLPRNDERIQNFLCRYLVRSMGGKGAYALLSAALYCVGQRRIETADDMLRVGMILLKQKGTTSIMGQILKTHAHRLLNQY